VFAVAGEHGIVRACDLHAAFAWPGVETIENRLFEVRRTGIGKLGEEAGVEAERDDADACNDSCAKDLTNTLAVAWSDRRGGSRA
jgi:hypothetical protein